MSLDNFRIVLIETSHPGNIGATARAMKTMGLHHLRLVRPKYFPHAEATARASGAEDLLDQATLYDNLPAAIADCVAVAGTSARLRTHHWPTRDARDSARRLSAKAAHGPVAIVFGRERSGLTNEELEHCQWLLNIPANPEYSSLNLAMAVQIAGYELRMADLALNRSTQDASTQKASTQKASTQDRSTQDSSKENTPTQPGMEAAPIAELERFYEHLQQVMLQTEFLNPENPRYLMRRLRLLFNRAEPDQNEVNILRGLLTSVQRLQSPPNSKDD
ncbi:MAG: RNA methyltransferase [Gammaproteobacteria bacterium]|nr:RNA methyltransferase [Gammaproteobacteria bacterium]